MTRGHEIPPPLPTPAQALAAQFYDWEKRGRGWQVWSESAFLEPPFRPFVHIYVPPAHIDDGRRPTLASSFVDRVLGLLSPKPPEESFDPALLALLQEPSIPPYEDTEGLVELQIVLSVSARVTNDTFTQFLISLAFTSSPLSFEVIGTGQEIVIQIVARESDAEDVTEQLRAHFPEVVVRIGRKYLWDLWMQQGEAPAAVVEFGLSEEFMRPLRTLATGTDPLVAATGALTNLREGEIGVLQVLFESVRCPWAESIFRAVTKDDGKAFFENAPEMVGFAKEKIRSPLYAAVIRVAGKSEDEERAWQIARNLGGALSSLNHPNVNRLMPLDNEGYDDIQHEVDLILRLTHRSGMLLSTEELVSLVHLPTAAVRAKKLKRHATKSKSAPAIATGHSVILGMNEHEDEEVAVSLSVEQRVKHMHVIGAPGTGKSTFLENLILQDIEQGHGVAVLDPHGDLIEQILERVKEERRKDVILFDPSDEEFSIGFNILSAHSEVEKNLLSSDLVGVFRRLSTAWGDQMTSVLGNAILAILESEQGGTLADLRRFLIEKSYREEFLKSVTDPHVVYYWRKEFPLLTGGKSLGPLLTRLDTFLRPKLIRQVVAQRENKLDFRKMMDEGKIFLAKLSQGAIGEENAWLLGSLLVSKFHQIALARQDTREEARKPFFMFIDEFHNFVTPSMTQILTGARKYRLGLILAHQELRQLGGAASEIGGSVLSNPYTRVCFRMGDDDARKLESGFSFFEAKDFQNLGTGEAIARIERAEFDFNLITPSLPQVEGEAGRECARAIRENSRRKYGTPRAEIEAELLRQTVADDEANERQEKPKRKPKPDRKETAPEPEPKPDVKPEQAPLSPVVDLATRAPETEAHASVASEPTHPPTLDEALESRAAQSDQPHPAKKTKAQEKPTAPPTPGRGGREHKSLQKRIALWAQGMGWKADMEYSIAGGAVDVKLERPPFVVACQVAVTTPPDYEAESIMKCLAAEFTHVVTISENREHLARIAEAARSKADSQTTSRLKFVTTQEFFAFMEALHAQAFERESTVRGFKVQVKRAQSFGVKNVNQQQELTEIAMKKLKKDGKK